MTSLVPGGHQGQPAAMRVTSGGCCSASAIRALGRGDVGCDGASLQAIVAAQTRSSAKSGACACDAEAIPRPHPGRPTTRGRSVES
jgi:hypothetical protein